MSPVGKRTLPLVGNSRQEVAMKALSNTTIAEVRL
jgi:hypothetical protein